MACGNHGGDHAQHLEDHWDIGDTGVQLATLGCAQRVGERDKKEPTTSATSPTHSRKQDMIEELPGWLKHLLAMASRTTASDFAQRGPLVTVGRWTLEGETDAGPANAVEVARLYCCV